MLTVEEFRAAGLALYGSGWQTRLAQRLNVNARTVRKWASGESPIPGWVEEVFRLMQRCPGDTKLPEWIFGDDVSRNAEYVIHARNPRFIARIGTDEELMSGFAWITANDEQIGEIEWLDIPPPDAELRRLMQLAETALEAYSENCDN